MRAVTDDQTSFMPTNASQLCYDGDMKERISQITALWWVWVALILLLVIATGFITGDQRNLLTEQLVMLVGGRESALIAWFQSIAPLTVWGHGIIHFCLSAFALIVMRSYKALLSLVITGALVELGQYFVPGRVPSMGDLWVNLGATLIVIVIYGAFQLIRRQRLPI